VTQRDIQRYIRKHTSAATKIKEQFGEEVEAEAARSRYLEEFARERTPLGGFYIKVMPYAGVIGLITSFLLVPLFMGSVTTLFVTAFVFALIFLGVAGIVIMLARSGAGKNGVSYSQYGADYGALWAAFGKFLDDFTSFREKEFPEFKLWGKYLVYAAALGKSERLIRELALQYPVDTIRTDDYWYWNNTALVQSITSGALLDTINSIQTTTYKASGEGGGGGFSSFGGSSGSGSSGGSMR